MKCLQDFSFSELEELVVSLGQPKFRATQLYDFLMRHKAYEEATNLPKGLIESLKENYFATSLKIIERLVGKDGTEKYLYALNDGNVVEGVFMPHRYGNTLCVSTQVGCRMGCAFCASGLGGLIRNLTAGEILGQVLCVNRLQGGTPKDRAITNVVLMGSGEPLDNYQEVTKFLELLSYEKGINISLRNVSLSTSGIVPKIRELAESNLPVVLTISLHAGSDEKRSQLMPINKAYPIKELIESAKYYFEKTHRRVIFEYALVEGKNSDKKSAEELAHLLKGFPCHVNLINLNYVKEKGLRGIKGNYIKEFIENLNKMGISATLRHSMGNDIDGACGQLRVKYLAEHDEVSRRGYED